VLSPVASIVLSVVSDLPLVSEGRGDDNNPYQGIQSPLLRDISCITLFRSSIAEKFSIISGPHMWAAELLQQYTGEAHKDSRCIFIARYISQGTLIAQCYLLCLLLSCSEQQNYIPQRQVHVQTQGVIYMGHVISQNTRPFDVDMTRYLYLSLSYPPAPYTCFGW